MGGGEIMIILKSVVEFAKAVEFETFKGFENMFCDIRQNLGSIVVYVPLLLIRRLLINFQLPLKLVEVSNLGQKYF